MSLPPSPRPSVRLSIMLATAIGLVAGGAAVALIDRTNRTDTAAIETIVHDYILAHPEIVPEAMQRLRARQTASAVGTQRSALETPFAGAWAGAAKPSVTVVMFTDYSCGYCRSSLADIDRLLAQDKSVRVVWREIPILGPESEAAARVALAAARQGNYLDFHRRMFIEGPPDAATIARVRDETRVTATATPADQQELDQNLRLARGLELSGTPTFVIGDTILQGAVGYDALKKAVDAARIRS